MIFVSILANAGGIGGGALLTPIYIWLFDFAVEDAIPLSKMTIFMGAIVNYLILKNARLEGSNLPLINYTLAGIIVPMLLAGTSIGVFGAKFFPPILILGFLSGFLVLSTFKMFQKALSMWRQETLENNVEIDNHSYSQTKVRFFQKNKNVFSKMSSDPNKIIQPIPNFLNKSFQQCSSLIQKKSSARKSKSFLQCNIEETDFLVPKSSTKKTSNRVFLNNSFKQSLLDSEDSKVPGSKSQFANPFWNSGSESQNCSIKICNTDKNKKMAQISKFRSNPGAVWERKSNGRRSESFFGILQIQQKAAEQRILPLKQAN